MRTPFSVGRIRWAVAILRAQRQGLRPGVALGRRVRVGKGVRITPLHGGRIEIGDFVEIGARTSISCGKSGRVLVGPNTFIGGSCLIAAEDEVVIGGDCMIAELVSIRDHDHDPRFPPRSGRMLVDPVHIGDRVWLASKASVLRGARVSSDCVLGAHSLARGDYPPATLIGGVPGRAIRTLDERLRAQDGI